MDEMTKQEEADGKKNEEKNADEREDSVARDQQKRKYYYDDAHGYEIYQPEADDEENEKQDEN